MESRLRAAVTIVVLLFLVVAGRLVQLQVFQGARYYRLSELNRIRRIVTPAPRGKILDRNGQLLADSRPAFSILLVPGEADSDGVRRLARILELTPEEIWDRLERSESGMTPVRLRRNADLELVTQVEENSTAIPGVIVKTEPQRNYPYGALFSHVLGYVNDVTEADLARDTTYRPGNTIGVFGLEAKYEPILRGYDGNKYVVVNAWGREVSTLAEREETPPQPGQELHLTLDAALQERARKLLEPYRKAAVVGLSLRDGGVLCLLSKPGFDPNLLSGAISADQWQELAGDKETPFVNRATMSTYSPGSAIKPFTAIAGLRRGLLSEHQTFQPCEGVFEYGHRRFKCTGKHGRLELVPAIVYSCNIYFYQAGLHIGIDPLADCLRDFGFGAPTGIDLPTERQGVVPDRAWLDKRYGEGKWSIGIVLNLAIGQGELQATPLQAANSYAMLAGSGDYYVPHLLDYVKTAEGRVEPFHPEKRHVNVPADFFSLIHGALAGVVNKGTGTAAYVPGVNVWGKTGTTEHTGGEDHAWFVGYAGRATPEVVFCVLIENAGKGGAVAAPIVRELVKQYYGITDQPETPGADSLMPDGGEGVKSRPRKPGLKPPPRSKSTRKTR
jgi:penicillin-binding protein 2